jgi:2-dehydro-3-deoxyphosphogluconate aldolase / (4S)-4-hydroxy-2-oxoglutarate aldolase
LSPPGPQCSPDASLAHAVHVVTQARLIVIIRTDRSDAVGAALRILADAGVRVAEISLTGKGALGALDRAVEELGDRLLIGAGTVRSPHDAEQALAAGARFLVSPNLNRDVVAIARERVVLHLPGVFSPTEVAQALADGAALIKLFPAGRLGPGYVRDLLAPFPEAKLVPTGGITSANVRGFLDAGAVAVAVGSEIVSPSTIGDREALSARVRQFQSLMMSRTAEERSHGD